MLLVQPWFQQETTLRLSSLCNQRSYGIPSVGNNAESSARWWQCIARIKIGDQVERSQSYNWWTVELTKNNVWSSWLLILRHFFRDSSVLEQAPAFLTIVFHETMIFSNSWQNKNLNSSLNFPHWVWMNSIKTSGDPWWNDPLIPPSTGLMSKKVICQTAPTSILDTAFFGGVKSLQSWKPLVESFCISWMNKKP